MPIILRHADKGIYKDIVTVFADDNKKYLSTNLGKKSSPNNDFVSNKVELLEYEEVI